MLLYLIAGAMRVDGAALPVPRTGGLFIVDRRAGALAVLGLAPGVARWLAGSSFVSVHRRGSQSGDHKLLVVLLMPGLDHAYKGWPKGDAGWFSVVTLSRSVVLGSLPAVPCRH